MFISTGIELVENRIIIIYNVNYYLNCIIIFQEEGQKFDPTTLPADRVSLELEIGSSVMFLYGSWLRHFFHLKVTCFYLLIFIIF